MLRRLASPMARRPLAFLLIALFVCGAAGIGFLRFGVDAGQNLLVGSGSSTGQAQARFTARFGSDPLVLVLTGKNPTAPYIERNLQRLTVLEDDLAHDPRVAEVLGPGTVARSALAATTAEVTKTLQEYPYFVAETNFLIARQNGNTDTTKLSAQFQTDLNSAQQLFALYVARAAGDANRARTAYDSAAIPPQDRILDSRERAVEAAVANDPLPPLFPEYLSGPGTTVDTAAARDFFDRITASFGDCDSSIATLLKITPTCQVFLERILLDLPQCPVEASLTAKPRFCPPKSQWAAVLPQPAVAASGSLLTREVITVRLTAAAAADRASVLAVQQKIQDMLTKGVVSDAYTRSLTQVQLSQQQQLGALAPTECGGVGQQQNSACYADFNDAQFAGVIAGAPLLTYGVVDSMTTALFVLLPLAIGLMAVLLLVVFRIRGRLWPLLAAVAATGATLGLSLATGTPITPAVLAGIPVLIGLGVDYAVQLVSRYDEERGRGADREEALAEAIGTSGPATLTAAIATLAGLAALWLIAGVDAGPLVAVPLVAEFAFVLGVGVIIAWLTALFVALPAAALRDSRARDVVEAPPVRPALRTTGIADSWRGALIPALAVAAIGWFLLPRVPVQTDATQLLAPSLPQLQAIMTVQSQTGYSNEIDIFVEGQVAGPYNQGGIPGNVSWQCQVAESIRSTHADQVATATSIADFFIASSSTSTTNNKPPCVATATPSPAPSPSASPGASTSPGASSGASPSASPSARRGQGIVLAAATAGASASASVAPSTSASAGATASPSPSAGATAPVKTQTAFLCDLRLLPALGRNLVQDIPVGTLPCPAIDKYLTTFLSNDTTPIDPTAARIVIGVQGTAIADQARLIDGIRSDVGKPPNGMTATPTGLAAVAAQAYDNIVGRALFLNLLPLLLVFLALLAVERNFRRAALPILPTAIAAGWAPLILLVLGLVPGGVGKTLGAFNPLTVVLGALVVALATEFGVVLLRRFDEECARGVHPDEAAAIALGGTGRAVGVSALTLGAGFAVLAVSALLPGGLPLLGSFGFTVLIDLGLAVAAVFGIMLPVAVAMERARYRPVRAGSTPMSVAAAPPAPARRRPEPLVEAAIEPIARAKPRPAQPRAAKPPVAEESVVEAQPEVPEAAKAPAPAAPPAPPGARRRTVSGRRRPPTPPGTSSPSPGPAKGPRRPGVSGRRRRGPGSGGGG